MEAIINITTFKGVSFGAVHYYGTIRIMDGLHDIELFRPITQDEIDNNPDRWYPFKNGEPTRCFNTWKEIILAGGEELKAKNINLENVFIEGIPNIEKISYNKSLEPLDTRPKCKKCGKVFLPGQGCYNTPRGLFCSKCYEKK